MPVCIPTDGNYGISEALNGHFGSAPYFIFTAEPVSAIRARRIIIIWPEMR